MRSILHALLSAGVANAAALYARDNTISTSSRNPTYAQSFGQSSQTTTVNSGVTYWLSGGGTHNFYGNLNNFGSVIVSQTDYLKQNPYAGGQTADFVGHDSLNGNLVNNAGALISLNDYGSASAPTYDWYLNTMQNRGSLQFCGRGDTGGSTYQLYCDQTCYNYGLIDFEQYSSNLGASFVWRNTVIGSSSTVNIYNEGAFRLVNVVYHNVQNVLGSGCWIIDSGAVLYLEDGSGAFQNPSAGPTFPNQNIYFTAASSSSGQYQTLHMDTAVYSRNSNFGPQVYNFGNNHAIEFYETIQSFSYANGVLAVTFVSGNKVNIKLGSGYDASAFYNARNPQNYNTAGYNAIFYRGAAPSQSVPGVCQVSLAKCADPASTAGVSTSTTTTTTTVSATTSKAPSTTTTTTTVPTTTITTTASTTTAAPTTTTTTTTSKTTTSTSTTTIPTTSSTTVTSTSSSRVTTTTSSTTTTTTALSTSSTQISSTTTTASTTTTTTTSGNGPCANGAPPSSTYVASNGDVYGICLNTDFNGPNLTPVSGITTPQQCADACSSTSGCIGGSLLRSAQTCYLKGVLNTPTSNSGVDSVYKISSGSGTTTSTSSSTSGSTTSLTTTSTAITSTTVTVKTTTSTPLTTTTTTIGSTTTSVMTSTTSAVSSTGVCAGGKGFDSTYTTSNGDVYGICLNTDFPGTNLGNPVSGISTAQQCADACSQTAGCIAGSLLRSAQLCYLKNTNNPASANTGVDSVYKISSGSSTATTTTTSSSSSQTTTTPQITTTTTPATTSATTTTATATTGTATTTSSTATSTGVCAGGKGFDSTYTASNGDVYGICLNTDFPGTNLGNPVSGITTAQQCADACSQTAGCIAGSLLRSAQLCYLKDVNNPASANSGVDSVYKISSGSGSGSTTTSTTTTRVTSSTTTSIPTTPTTTTGTGSGPVTVTVTTTVTAQPTTSSGCSWVCPATRLR